MRRSAVLTWPAKVFLSLAGLSLVTSVAYGRLTNDIFGISALLGLVIVGGFSTVIVAGFRVNEVAPASDADVLSPRYQEVAQVPSPGGGAWPALATVALTLGLLGLVLGPISVYFGLGVAVVTAVGWLARVSSERTGREISLLPAGLPVLALFTIASVMFFMSRILLAVPEQASTVIALIVALIIMGAAIFFSVRPAISPTILASALAVFAAAMVGGGVVAAAAGERSFEHPGEHGKELELTALNTAFDHAELTLAKGAEGKLKFSNQDPGVPHNFALFEGADAQAKLAFRGDIVTGPTSTTYTFETPAPGKYYFQCDVHPNTMKGTLEVTEAPEATDEGTATTVADAADAPDAPAGSAPTVSTIPTPAPGQAEGPAQAVPEPVVGGARQGGTP